MKINSSVAVRRARSPRPPYAAMALILILSVLGSGCAKTVQVLTPQPPDLTSEISAVANSQMTSEAKAAIIAQLIQSAQAEYQALLNRLDKQGSNTKEAVLQFLATAASFAGLALTASK